MGWAPSHDGDGSGAREVTTQRWRLLDDDWDSRVCIRKEAGTLFSRLFVHYDYLLQFMYII